jgi:hypothetical protein
MSMPVEGLTSVPTYIYESELSPDIWDAAVIITKKKKLIN